MKEETIEEIEAREIKEFGYKRTRNKKGEKQWWDMSKEKKPRAHSVEFLQKQSENAANKETGDDKFDLVNRPYFMPYNYPPNASDTYKLAKQIEKSVKKLARAVAGKIKFKQPPRTKKVTTAGKGGFMVKEVIIEEEDDALS